MSKKSAIVTAVGFLVVGLRVWMHSLHSAGLMTLPSMWIGAVPMAIVLIVLASLAFLHGDALDSLVFFGFGTLVWSRSAVAPAAGPSAGLGWDYAIWTVYFLALAWAWRRGTAPRAWFPLTFGLALLCGAVYNWTGANIVEVIGGYLGLVAGLSAIATTVTALRPSTAPDPTGGINIAAPAGAEVEKISLRS